MKTSTLSMTLAWLLLSAVAWLARPSSCAAAAAASKSAPPDSVLETIAQQSKFVRTGHYDEVQRLCETFAQEWPDNVRCMEFGLTPEGRPIVALIAPRSGALTPGAARERGLPVMLMQGGIHAGEIEGKDAGF